MNKSVVDSLGHILCVLCKELKYPNDLDILMTKFFLQVVHYLKDARYLLMAEVIVVILTNCQSNTIDNQPKWKTG